MEGPGKFLLIAGVVIASVGAALMFFDKIPFLGKLPGDIRVERENIRFYFPFATSIVLSLAVSLVLWLFNHFRK